MDLVQVKESISKKQDQIDLIEAELSEKRADLEENKKALLTRFTRKFW